MEIKCPKFIGNKQAVCASLKIKENDHVKKGDVLLFAEAGKGNIPIKAPIDGIITNLTIKEMEPLFEGQILCNITESIDSSIDVVVNGVMGTPPFTVGLVLKKEHDVVTKGEDLVFIESGKGNYKIKATMDGIISSVLCKQGDQVSPNDILFKITPSTPSIKEEEEKEEVTQTKTSITKDVVVIGGGPGGYVAAIYAAQNGKSACVIEEKELGGTCLNVGCIPTKTLVKTSEVYKECSNASIFGIEVPQPTIHMDEVMQRKETVRTTLVGGIHYLMEKHNIEVIKGHASFETPTHIKVDNKMDVFGTDVILASGSKVAKVPIPGLDLDIVMDSTQALSLQELPKSITIIGGGVIGMEFACIFNNLGVEVQVVEFMDRLVNMVDLDASNALLTSVRDQGILVNLNSKVTRIMETDTHKAIVLYERDGKEHALSSDKVLCAIGRVPNTDGLNLEGIHVEMNPRGRGVKVNEHMQTNIEHLYAIGDVTNIMQLAHVASHQATIAVDKIVGTDKTLYYTSVPSVIFTSPEIASVGYSEEQCIKQEIPYACSMFDFTGNGKALTMNQNSGFVKLVIHKETRELIGGTIVGPDASSLIASLALGVKNRMKIEAYMDTVFAHPTTSEAIHEASLGFGLGSLHS